MKHTFSKLQMLNISTGILHTKMKDIYIFFEKVIEPGIMTHNLSRALKAITPVLRGKPELIKFFDLGYTPNPENSEQPVEFEFTEADKEAFWENYNNI